MKNKINELLKGQSYLVTPGMYQVTVIDYSVFGFNEMIVSVTKLSDFQIISDDESRFFISYNKAVAFANQLFKPLSILNPNCSLEICDM